MKIEPTYHTHEKQHDHTYHTVTRSMKTTKKIKNEN